MKAKLNTNCFNDFPLLKTKRLTLRKLMPRDVVRIFEMRKNTRNNEFILRSNMENMEDARKLMDKCRKGYKRKEMIVWAAILRKQKQIIGTCGFNKVDHQNLRAEIGGELYIDYWGKGIALEGVQEIIHFGFNTMCLNAIDAKVNPENRGVVYILEQLGFDREAYFKKYGYYQNSFHDMAVYTKFNDKAL